MRTHLQLSENCEIVGKHCAQQEDYVVSVDEFTEDGILYLTLASLSAKDFFRRYGVVSMIKDILHRPCNLDSFANPHFLDDYRSIKKAVMTIVNRDRAMPIVLSGHGVGGSLALIAGYDLVKKGYTVNQVVTFGAPRALNSSKAIPLVTYPLSLVTVQYVLPADRFPKMFRFTRYKHINRTELDHWPLQEKALLGEDINYHSIDSYIECLGVMENG